MTIEQKGPGGVGNNYGPRATSRPTAFNVNKPRDIYTGFNPDLSQKVRSNVLYKSLAGYLNVPVNTGASPFTLFMQTALEAQFDSVRIGVLHASVNAAAGVKVMVGTGSTMSNPGTATVLNNFGINAGDGTPAGRVIGWRTATWGGAATGTLPAVTTNATGSGGANSGGSECSITWTDPIVAPSVARTDVPGALPLIWISLVWPAGVDRTTINMETFVGSGQAGGQPWTVSTPTIAPYGRTVQVAKNPTQDGVATPGFNYSAGAVMEYTEWPPIVIEYTLRNGQGYTLLVPGGDSLDEGAASFPVKCGWMAAFQNAVSTQTNPVSYCNLAVGGSTMDDWIRRVNGTYSSFKNVNVYIRSASPNSVGGPITALAIANLYASFGKLKALVNQPGTCFFTGTWGPTNSLGSGGKNYGASDFTQRLPYVENIRNSTYNYVDIDKIVSTSYVDANGQFNIKPEYAAPDGIHYTIVGYQAQGAGFAAVWNNT